MTHIDRVELAPLSMLLSQMFQDVRAPTARGQALTYPAPLTSREGQVRSQAFLCSIWQAVTAGTKIWLDRPYDEREARWSKLLI